MTDEEYSIYKKNTEYLYDWIKAENEGETEIVGENVVKRLIVEDIEKDKY